MINRVFCCRVDNTARSVVFAMTEGNWPRRQCLFGLQECRLIIARLISCSSTLLGNPFYVRLPFWWRLWREVWANVDSVGTLWEICPEGSTCITYSWHLGRCLAERAFKRFHVFNVRCWRLDHGEVREECRRRNKQNSRNQPLSRLVPGKSPGLNGQEWLGRELFRYRWEHLSWLMLLQSCTRQSISPLWNLSSLFCRWVLGGRFPTALFRIFLWGSWPSQTDASIVWLWRIRIPVGGL